MQGYFNFPVSVETCFVSEYMVNLGECFMRCCEEIYLFVFG